MCKKDKHLFVNIGRLSFVLTIVFCLLFRHSMLLESCFVWFTGHKMEILSCALTVNTTILGFILAAVTILLSCMPKRLREVLKTDKNADTAESMYVIFKLLLEDAMCFYIVLFIGTFSLQGTILRNILFLIVAFSVLLFFRLCAMVWLTLQVVKIALVEKNSEGSCE